MCGIRLFVVVIAFAYVRANVFVNLWNDGYFGVLMNFATELSCSPSTYLKEDLGNTTTLYWFDSNTGRNESFMLEDAAKNILNDSSFNSSKSWEFYIHGFRTSIESDTTLELINALMTIPDIYIFVLDHSNYTYSDLNILGSYQRSVGYSQCIALNLKTYFFDVMLDEGVSEENIHMIGHSMGAQIVGYLGALLTDDGIALEKCTGLDPAGPCFDYNDNELQLSSDDCKFVEVMHCNSGQLGSEKRVSDFESFANCAGKMQPHCWTLTNDCYAGSKLLQSIVYTTGVTASCSHMWCISMYAASINGTAKYNSIQCDDYDSFKSGACGANETYTVGFLSDSALKYDGSYYFNSNECDCDID